MQIKDLIVTGDARILGNLYANGANVSGGGTGGGEGSGATYWLEKAGNTIHLYGSDGSHTSVQDDSNSYGAATTSSAGLMSAADKSKLNDIASGAEVNQNAFSNVKVGTTTIAADGKTDTLTLVAGSNITLTPDATNDSVTIAAKDTIYTHPSYTATTGVPTADQTPAFGGSFNVTQPVSDATGHIIAMNSRRITIPSSIASASANGLMTSAMVTKLNGIADDANAYTLPSAGSSLGGVKSGGDVTISGGVITVNDDSHNHTIANVDNLQSTLNNKSDKGHPHSADDITSGTLPIARGGTGATTATAARTNIGAASTDDLARYLPLAGGTITGELGVGSKITQGSPSNDSTVTSMNRFQADLFVEGNGTAPNAPKAAGFYLGKSATDGNRHMDIVSGETYSYIDFNKANREVDYDVRLLVNVEDGYTDFMWGNQVSNRAFNVSGTLMQGGYPVALAKDIPTDYATSTHNHSASDITSGTLPVSRGGTGATKAAIAVSNLGGLSVVVSATEPTNSNAMIWVQTVS